MKPAILLIPVENQVRELDAKLLLACMAARRGFASVIGPRRETHFHIASFPRGIYLSKSVTAASDMMFGIMHIYGQQAQKLKQAHGDFILINTNFNHVNAFFPAQNLFRPVKNPGEKPQILGDDTPIAVTQKFRHIFQASAA